MKTVPVGDQIRAAAVCAFTAGACCYLAFVSWHAWHDPSTDDVVVLFPVALFVCCLPLWLVNHRHSLRRDAPTILSFIAAAAVFVSIAFLPNRFGYDLLQPAWHTPAEFAVGVLLYGLRGILLWSFIGWFFHSCEKSIARFFPAPSRSNASSNHKLYI